MEVKDQKTESIQIYIVYTNSIDVTREETFVLAPLCYI